MLLTYLLPSLYTTDLVIQMHSSVFVPRAKNQYELHPAASGSTGGSQWLTFSVVKVAFYWGKHKNAASQVGRKIKTFHLAKWTGIEAYSTDFTNKEMDPKVGKDRATYEDLFSPHLLPLTQKLSLLCFFWIEHELINSELTSRVNQFTFPQAVKDPCCYNE